MPKKILKGFTLIELLVVVAIIGILSAIGVVAYSKYSSMAQTKAIKAQKENKFKEEIINYKIKSKNNEIDFNKDEHPREGINFDALSRLKLKS